MTAIDAAIVELEAHREQVSQAIRMLRRFAHVVEERHEAIAVPATKPPSAPELGGPLTQVMHALRVAATPLRMLDLCSTVPLPPETIRKAVKELETRKQVRAHGKTSARAYTLTAPRPRAVAGTQAAPPVGPSSANGSSGYEVVWDGAKERNGEAPSLLQPRERKS